MAANNSTKKKSPTLKQTKAVKQSSDQITLEETASETPKPQKPKKSTKLKAQLETVERAKQEVPPKKKAPIEKPAIEEKVEPLKEEPIEIPQKQKRPELEQVFMTQPQIKDGKSKKKKKKHKGEEKVLKLSLDKNAPFAYSEAYKSLRTNINFISSTSDVKSIVITSAIPQESKSNVAVNMAINMASEGKKVILIDCDLRKPVLHKYLRVGGNKQGLSDVLASRAKLDDCIVGFKDVKIHLLPAGTVPPNPSEMLSQERMKKLVDFFKEQYDFVILDAPPVSVVTDAAVLGHYVDGAILVVRSKFAPKETIKLAVRKLQNVDIKILGVVLTRYNAKKSTKNSAYTYSYSYGYGYRYGDNNG